MLRFENFEDDDDNEFYDIVSPVAADTGIFEIHDFTSASPMEKLIILMEQQIHVKGPYSHQTDHCSVVYQLDHNVFDATATTGAIQLLSDSKVSAFLSYRESPLYRYFRVPHALVISCPNIEVDEHDASKLLSILAMASQNCSSTIPIFAKLNSPSTADVYYGRISQEEYSARLQVQQSRHIPNEMDRLSKIEQYLEAQCSCDRVLISSCFTFYASNLPQCLESVALVAEWPFSISGTFVENSLYSDFSPATAKYWSSTVSWQPVDSIRDAEATTMLRDFVNVCRSTCATYHNNSYDTFRLINSPTLTSPDHIKKDMDRIFSLPSVQAEDIAVCPVSILCPASSLLHQYISCTVDQMQNVNTVIAYWEAFVSRVRDFWERAEPIPLLTGNVDMKYCLLHQKLELVEACIQRKRKIHFADESDFAGWGNLDDLFGNVIPDMLLLETLTPMHAPRIQSHPPITSDMFATQLEMLQELGNSPEASLERSMIQGSTVLSDMQAFKAVNSGAVFGDFVRWYSPNDWVVHDEYLSPELRVTSLEGELSARMQEPGNLWETLWDKAEPITSDQQEQLFNYDKEAELALDYLWSLDINSLLHQLGACSIGVCTTQILSNALSYRECEFVLNKARSFNAQIEHRMDCNQLMKNKSLSEVFFSHLEALEVSVSQVTSLDSYLGPLSPPVLDSLLGSQRLVPLVTPEDRACYARVFNFEDGDEPPSVAPNVREFCLIGYTDTHAITIGNRVYVNLEQENFVLATCWVSQEW